MTTARVAWTVFALAVFCILGSIWSDEYWREFIGTSLVLTGASIIIAAVATNQRNKP